MKNRWNPTLLALLAMLMATSTTQAEVRTDPRAANEFPVPEPILISLGLDLSITVCNSNPGGDYSSCRAGGTIGSCGSQIQLDPMWYLPGQAPNSYRGFWSQVEMEDSTRYIGIVTVLLYRWEDVGDGQTPYTNYNITVEILGDSGVVAKMVLNTDNLQTIPGVSLMGPSKQVGWSTYTPYLYVSSASESCTWPIPEDPVSPVEPVPAPPSNVGRTTPQWEVLKGTIAP